MEPYVLKQPDHSKYNTTELLARYINNSSIFDKYLDAINSPSYLFWNKAMHKPLPNGFTAEEAWVTSKILRKIRSIDSPIYDIDGSTYTYIRLPHFDKQLHSIDLRIGGKFLVSNGTGEDKQKFLTRGIIEEAIASSQLEGASTSRRYAKKMIAENKKPKNVSEKMIFNNYTTMIAIENEYKDKELSIELLLDIHTSLTQYTLEDPQDVGRIRLEGDFINVIYKDKIAHVGAPRSFMDRELPRLIEFANNDDEFIHPIIKASILHFWIAYLHPFADGNGRLARSVFYWYLFKSDYWGAAFVPISMVIKRAQSQYTNAYLYAEQGGKDLTYFIDFSIKKISMALSEFDSYVETLAHENKSIDIKLKGSVLLNDRQKQIIHYVTKNETNYVTESSQRIINGIARNTAKSDLSKLLAEDLLISIKDGRQVKYFASKKLIGLTGGRLNQTEVPYSLFKNTDR